MNSTRRAFIGLTSTAVLSTLLGGCRTNARIKTPSPQFSQARTLEGLTCERKGNAADGIIIHLKDHHSIPGLSEKRLRDEVGAYQHKIALELYRLAPDALFIEDVPHRYTAEHASRATERTRYQAIFPHGIPAIPTAEQRLTLGKDGAPRIYLALTNTPLEKSIEPEEYARIRPILLEEVKKDTVQDIATAFTYREARWTDHICKYLRQHRGARVVIVAGSAHQLADDIERNCDAQFSPQLHSRSWPVEDITIPLAPWNEE
jgi:hypothetical protein